MAVPRSARRPGSALAGALASLVLLPGGTFAQQADAIPTAEEMAALAEKAERAPLFAAHDPLRFTLRTRIDFLRDERPDEEEVDGTLSWIDEAGTAVTLPVEVRTRGNFRREKRNCNFPPLRLDVPKGRAEGTVFEGQDKLKLVTPCHDSRDNYQEYVIQEYLVYRTFELLTPVCFRVRLVQITYEDDDGEYDTRTKTAFLIEDEEQMAYRNSGTVSEWDQFHPAAADGPHAGMVALFQYMIGNTDWSGPYFHNVKMMRAQDGRYLLVPYDFDFSGIVNARYATPAPELPIRNVRDRLFRGFCREDVDHAALRARFLALREPVRALYEGTEGISDKTRERSLDYYDRFFRTLEEDRRYQRQILDACRSMPG